MFQKMMLTLVTSLLVFTSSVSHGADRRDWSQYPDYGALRQEIGWREDFFSLCELNRPLRQVQEQMNAQDWDQVVQLGEPWLQSCPIDIRIHFYMGIALSEKGQDSVGAHHLEWMKGLMDSIVASGDGETPDTPYVVVSVAEEYDYLNIAGLRPTNQSLVQGKKLVDAITAVNREGQQFTVYFSPEAHFARIDKIVDGMEKE